MIIIYSPGFAHCWAVRVIGEPTLISAPGVSFCRWMVPGTIDVGPEARMMGSWF